MPARLSAVDAVSPAFEQTKQLLFRPFRFGQWARLAIVALLTGEYAGGWSGGVNVGDLSSLPFPPGRGGGDTPDEFFLLADPTWERFKEFLPWIAAGLIALFVLVLILMYIGSVFRFILLDAVLYNRYRLREGWSRWQSQGVGYFLWQLGFGLAVLVALSLVIGIPIYLAWQAGVFRHADQNIGLLIGGGVLLFFLVIGLVIVGATIGLFTKDFVVPLMALENLGVLKAWGRLLPMLGGEKLAYTGYVLMKIVLAVGSAILFGIVNLIVLLVLLIPLAVAAVVVVAAGAAAGLSWNPATISAAILLGFAALGLLFYAIAFVSVPAAVFFQSYTLHFFGGRYFLLGNLLTPAPPPAPAAPAATS